MSKQKEIKTNAMRILEAEKIPFVHHTYECGEFTDGIQVADLLGLPYEKVYKTLVTVGAGGGYFVFVIPVDKELDRKKAASSVGEKSVELLPVREIQDVTGYVRGGCTAIGMKKQYTTRIDKRALEQPVIFVSGGKLGLQVELSPRDLSRVSGAEFAEIVRK